MRLAPGNSVAIIGGGFSGTLQAINLLRHAGPRAVLIERRHGQLGRGVAYSAAHPRHLLNVRAGNMSAFPDDADHFVRWLARKGAGTAASFVPRGVYGSYLSEMLREVGAGAPHRLEILHASAVDVIPGRDGVSIILDAGQELAVDAAVLAPGNLPPHAPPEIDADGLPRSRYAPDPWAGDIADGLGADDAVLLLGTGLTAIDAALLLEARGFTGRILALSRRGLVPRAHHDVPPSGSQLSERPPAELSQLVRFIRRRAAVSGWRDAVDALRPMTQIMWGAAPPELRSRFLRHLRPWWDVHRHRLAPDVAARIERMQVTGRLSFAAGKLVSVADEDAVLRVSWRPRGADEPRTGHFRRVVNCTGPQGDLLRTDEPLLRRMLAAGTIRPDQLRLGLDVDSQSRVIGASGEPQPHIFAIGPMTRGGLWEIVAVPDLRHQTWTLARRLANAHWVGGEGL